MNMVFPHSCIAHIDADVRAMCPPGTPPRRAGFNVSEIMVVVVIRDLAALVAPFIGAFAMNRLRRPTDIAPRDAINLFRSTPTSNRHR